MNYEWQRFDHAQRIDTGVVGFITKVKNDDHGSAVWFVPASQMTPAGMRDAELIAPDCAIDALLEPVHGCTCKSCARHQAVSNETVLFSPRCSQNRF